MENKKTLEQVLQELKEAEKEYKEKCLKYGIEEKHKRKKPEVQSEQTEAVNEESNNEEINEEMEETASEN